MIFLDTFVRFSGVGMLCILAVLAWRHRGSWQGVNLLVLACITVAALLLGYAPEAVQPPDPLLAAVRYLDVPHLVFVWLFALSLFDEQFEVRPWHWIVGIVYSAPILWARLGYEGLVPPPPGWFIPFGSATSVVLIGHLIFSTIRGRSDDLLEKRRASRIHFVLVISVMAVAAALTDLMPAEGAFDKRTAKAMALWPAIAFGTYWMLSFDRSAVRFGSGTRHPEALEAADRTLWQKLEAAMVEGEAYAEPALTIASLASQLGVGQHRLRALINTRLGHANFSAFVNSYRVAAVQQAMREPATAHLPILTLALDAGFKSLSPFNKAFKQETGMTPSAWREDLTQTG